MKKLLTVFTFLFLLSVLTATPVFGVYGGVDPGDYGEVGFPPANCPDDFLPDTTCSRAKILNASTVCFENRCPTAQTYDQLLDASGSSSDDAFDEFEVFGATFFINSSERIAALINIGISTFLGIISFYALGRGVYVAGFKIAGTTEQETIEESQRELTQLIVAFAMAWSFILILQVVFSILGLGSINDYILVGEQPGSSTIVIN